MGVDDPTATTTDDNNRVNILTSPPRIRVTRQPQQQQQQQQPVPTSTPSSQHLRPRQRQSAKLNQSNVTRVAVAPLPTRTTTTTVSQQQRNTGYYWQRINEEQRAVELVQRLEYGADLLLEKLFAYLSQLPEEEEDDQVQEGNHDPLATVVVPTTSNSDPGLPTSSAQGMSLPAGAVAWLSSQLYPVPWEEDEEDEEENKTWGAQNRPTTLGDMTKPRDDDQEECCSLVSSYPQQQQQYPRGGRRRSVNNHEETRWQHNHNHSQPWVGGVALRDRLSLIRFLLPRVQLIRITRQPWPPDIPTTVRSQQQSVMGGLRSPPPVTTPPRRRRVPSELQCNTPYSVISTLTMEHDMETPVDNNNSSNAMSNEQQSLRLAFLQYMHQLQHAPTVDLRMFPRIRILILESVPPSWIVNLHTLRSSLEVLRLDRAAVYHLPSLLFSKSQLRKWKQDQDEKLQRFVEDQSTTQTSPNESATARLCFPHLTHLKLDNCHLSELSGLSFCLSKLPKLRYLSLQHNDIHQEKSALRGLQTMTNLSHVDLRYNRLRSLPRANLYLGGQMHTLKLSYNQITSTRGGLDRCYSLKELWLDGNCIQDLTQVSGLARLPELKLLRLHNNPVTTLGNPHFDPGWKLQLWTWFQEERRAAIPIELPVLVDVAISTVNGEVVTVGTGIPSKQEWKCIQDGSFSNVVQRQTGEPWITQTHTQSLTPGSTPLRESLVSSNENIDHTTSFLTDSTIPSVASTPLTTSTINSMWNPSLQTLRVTKKSKTRRAKIRTNDPSTTRGKGNMPPKINYATSRESTLVDLKGDKATATAILNVSFSLHDVLVSLHDPIKPLQESNLQPPPLTEQGETSSVDNKREQDSACDVSSPSMHETDEEQPNIDEPTNQFDTSNRFANIEEEKRQELERAPDDDLDPSPSCEDVLSNANTPETLETTEPSSTTIDSPSDPQLINDEASPELPSKHTVLVPNEVANEEIPTTLDFVATAPDPSKNDSNNPKEERIFPDPKRKVATIKLHRHPPTTTLSMLDCDWDELIKRVAEGMIPDGIVKSPVVNLEHSASAVTFEVCNGGNKVFSDETTKLLLADAPPGTASIQNKSMNQSSNSLSASGPLDTTFDSLPNTLPDHVWKDDGSALSSLGASLDNITSAGAFQIAEENSFYDGPEYCREMKVVENLKLFFEEFVFAKSVPNMPQVDLEELEEDRDDWQSIMLFYPRIQLWPDDRRRLERLALSAAIPSADWAEHREQFLHLWEEEIIPCGKPALRRLPPNRRIRLGFHGDKLFEGPDLDAYSECRKVLLCVSSKAFYIILREDAVTAHHKEQSKQRRFPLPIGKDVLFRDAPWPHSVARHSLHELEAICIGFEFQRLTLRFRTASFPKSDPFVYVVVCGNKKSAVKLLQELQKAVKDLKDSTGAITNSSSGRAPVAIENDSNMVFDALTEAISPEPLGTVMHYQILHQFWKHGDRGTVRRTFVLTEMNLFLLDEDYFADGHNLSNVTVKEDKMANVKYRKVDEASLEQVTEVQAAGADPRAITVIIGGASTLSRTHRWRLLCRDREGAERLVDDVRRALGKL